MTQKQQIENRGGGLSEKRIVVLGGSSGIGLSVAQQAVAQGATAIIASSNADRVKQAVATLDGKAEGHTLDLSKERDIQNFFQEIGEFDHLVVTAGDKLQLNMLEATDLTKPGTLLSCAIGLLWLRSSTQARISVRMARSCSQPESQASARTRDGQ
jgi:NAD(P)-dependent dehydrogenase (short-subunit alcohol dehydrogenase family)